MEEFCKNLPKLELHAHLNGSLSESTLTKLGCVKDAIGEYQKLNLFKKSSRTLEECFLLFKIAHEATKTKTAVYTATACVINEFYLENCVYLELRTTPRSEENMSKEEYIESVVKAINDNEQDIIVKLILSIDRRHSLEFSTESLDIIVRMKQKYPNVVKGIDLCGNPSEGSFFVDIFSKAREAGLFVTLHCGEVENDEEVRLMLGFKPDRIGHATFLQPKCWEEYCKQPVPIECCLTSNVICGTVSDFKDHHLQHWIKSELPFTLSTDDKGVFCTTLTNEYYIAHKTFDLTKEELFKISLASVDYSFASDAERQKLKELLATWKANHVF